ncbi:MAG: T9SS type A sorting domain-containing protein [Saprospiraceae bacterium]|nr:T9SS type A sorting domain-containing protein [Saprospiraceae bacterium]
MGCINFNGNIVRLDTIPFYVSVSGTYTINRSSIFGLVTNIYQSSFNLGTVCENFIASSGTHNGMSSSLSANVTAILTAGVKYVLVISSFGASTPALPANYSVSVNSAPPGGSLISGPLNPGGGFSYTFIVRDAFLGNIVMINANPDLSTLPAGNYIITGLSYSNSSSLPSLPINYSAFISDYVVNGLSGFCGKASLNERTVIIQSPLSVNFLSFEAHKEGARGLLKWEVSEERDLDYYLLEHSPDALFFSELGIIEANYSGKSGENFYQFYDGKPFSGKNYYRLSGVDLDGTLSSAGIAQLTFVGDLSLRIFPNPVSENQLTFVYDSESESDRLMSIYNMQGLLMSQTKISGLSAKAAPQNINISGLSPGVYIFEIIDGESTLRKRFVKSK